ncbi:MAG: SMI1/KNR4 family protein [Polyangiales bacterium]
MSLWAPLEAWLSAHPSEDGATLNDGATEADLARLEATLGVPLPTSFREAWAAHDGETPGDRTLVPHRHLLSLAAIQSEWEVMNESLAAGASGGPENACDAGPGVRPLYWSARWVPFALLGGATDFHCLDLDPGAGGRFAQVIRVSDDLLPREVVAPDLESYFDALGQVLRGEPSAPPAVASPSRPPGGREVRALGLRLALAAAFWFCVWHAVVTRGAAWIAAAVALWVAWFAARHWARRLA